MQIAELANQVKRSLSQQALGALIQHLSEPEPIAIVGMACRFPGGADDPFRFWELVRDGQNLVTEVPAERWSLRDYFDPTPGVPGKMYTRYGAFLRDVDKFDADFFEISPLDASYLDPQQRLLLEVAWEALEDAGLAKQEIAGSDAGVFWGLFTDDYYDLQYAGTPSAHQSAATGTQRSMAAGRISYWLDLHGPSFVLDTACSSSLVALHVACQSLRARETSFAIAGGVQLYLTPREHVMTSLLGMVSPDGACKLLDAAANGFVHGEGCGALILKRLSDARSAGDRIHALIRGSAVNQDGRTLGITAPNAAAQERVIRSALAAARVEPKTVGYVEMHGTGTALGDPCEVDALRAVYARDPSEPPCALGSAKTNIGHAAAAAGVAGVVRAVMSLAHGEVAPNPHLRSLNPRVRLEGSGLVCPTRRVDWARAAEPRRAAVSSFGASGTNAHVVLEERSEEGAPEAAEGPRPLVLSGRTLDALFARARQFSEWLESDASGSVADVCYTACCRRTHWEHRAVVVGSSKAELATELRRLVVDGGSSVYSTGTISRGRVAYVFPGQGSQNAGMGRELARRHPEFRASLAKCESALAGVVDWSLEHALAHDMGSAWLNGIDGQLVLLALEISLATVLREWGVAPDALVGHSMGELAAACVAGVISIEDGFRLLATRGRLAEQFGKPGAMLVCELAPPEARRLAADHGAWLAASNGPRESVIVGPDRAIEALLMQLEAREVYAKKIRAAFASHCPLVSDAARELESAFAGLAVNDGISPIYSSSRAQRVPGKEMGAAYWAENLRTQVAFAETIEALLRDGFDTFVEMGPHPSLSHAIREIAGGRDVLVVNPLRREEGETASVLNCLGELHVRGRTVHFDRIAGLHGRVVSLPAYPWQRERLWAAREPLRTSEALTARNLACIAGAGSERQTWLASQDPEANRYLEDHRVLGQAALPGAAMVDLFLAVVRELPAGSDLVLRDLSFQDFVTVGPGEKLELCVDVEREDEQSFRLRMYRGRSTDAGQPVVASATARTRAPAATLPQAPVPTRAPAERLRDFAVNVPPADYYALWDSLDGVKYGPGFQGIQELHVTDRAALALVRLPDEARSVRAGYALHPALLDACFQVVGGPLFARYGSALAGALFVPVAIEAAEFVRLPSVECWVAARLRDGGSGANDDEVIADIELVDASGGVLGTIRGFRAARRQLDPLVRLRWGVAWRVADATPSKAELGRVIVVGSGRTAEALMEQLRTRGVACECFADSSSGDDGRLAASLDLASRVVFAPDAASEARPDLADTGKTLCFGLIGLVRRWLGSTRESLPRLYVVTHRACSVDGSEGEPSPAAGALWGMVPTLDQELPALHATAIDVEASSLGLAELLAEELCAVGNERRVAFRSGRRFVARLVRQVAEAGALGRAGLPVRRDGTYLVTGGLGGIGLLVAERLAKLGAGAIVLCGRKPPSEVVRGRLARMSANGTHVRVECCDVTDEARLGEVLATIDRSAPLLGVMHCAGLLADAPLAEQDATSFARAYDPKVRGALTLVRLAGERKLDFIVFFSSMSALLGSAGQLNTAAANGFMDTWAVACRRQGLPAISVNWGLWREVGAAWAQPEVVSRLRSLGFDGIAPELALDALFGLSVNDAGQCAVASFDAERWCRYVDHEHHSFFREIMDVERAGASLGDRDALLAEISGMHPEHRKQKVVDLVAREIARVLRTPAAKIRAQTPLDRLGITSMSALELRSGIERALGVRLQATMAWRHPDVGALAETLLSKLGYDLTAATQLPAVETEDSTLHEIQALSAVDARAALEAELLAASDGA